MLHSPFRFQINAHPIRQAGIVRYGAAVRSSQFMVVQIKPWIEMKTQRIVQLQFHLLLPRKVFQRVIFLRKIPLFHESTDFIGLNPHTEINHQALAA